MSTESLQLWTIGHSTRSAEEFAHILVAHRTEVLIDVRSFPGSRRHPQFNKSALSEYLANFEIKYVHAPSLGGRRSPRADSLNTAWQNASFRAYADYMETPDFRQAVKELLELAGQ